MIRYDLVCAGGHLFDGWFSDSASFDSQQRLGLITCSHCGNAKVEKQLMAPGLALKATGPTENRNQQVQNLRDFRKMVEEKADYVGDQFAAEARRIYYAETKKREIYGEARPDEVKGLLEEGITVIPLPRLPEEQH